MSDIFETSLLGSGVPLDEAATFFLKLKTATAQEAMDAVAQHGNGPGYAPPDTTGVFEGPFTVPPEQALALMAEMVKNEVKTMYAYKVYANSLRDLSHHSIAEEFESHAEQELEHVDFLLRRMAVLGGPVQVPDIPAPPASADPVDIVNTMIRIEQEGIARWKMLHSITGDNPTKYKIEEYMTREQEHLDELWQLIPHQARGEIGPSAPQIAAPVGKIASSKKPEHVEKAEQRAEGNLAARRKMHEGTRGELYGDLVGRLVGGSGGAVAAKKGGPLAQVAAAALGQHLGGHAGKTLGKEVDARRAKHAFQEGLNMLAMEQQAEQAQAANEAQYYREMARQTAEAKSQLEQQVQMHAQQLQDMQAQQDQQNQALQQTLQGANNTATQALTRAVQATQEAIQQKQQAADMAITHDQLRQKLRELADGGGSAGGPGDINAQAAPGENMVGPAQEGPAGQAPGAQSAPGAAPPEGAQSAGGGNQNGSSPESGAQGAPGTEQQLGAYPAGGVKMGSVGKELSRIVAQRAPYALGGAIVGGGLHSAMTAGGTEPLRRELEMEEMTADPGSFRDALAIAQAKTRLAFQELAEKHPAGALAASTLAGGAFGAAQGPELVGRLKNIGSNLKRLTR